MQLDFGRMIVYHSFRLDKTSAMVLTRHLGHCPELLGHQLNEIFQSECHFLRVMAVNTVILLEALQLNQGEAARRVASILAPSTTVPFSKSLGLARLKR